MSQGLPPPTPTALPTSRLWKSIWSGDSHGGVSRELLALHPGGVGSTETDCWPKGHQLALDLTKILFLFGLVKWFLVKWVEKGFLPKPGKALTESSLATWQSDLQNESPVRLCSPGPPALATESQGAGDATGL